MNGPRKGLPVALVLVVLAGAIASTSFAKAAEPGLHNVLIEAFSFVPERLEVRAGDRVEWTNTDIAPHTATARGSVWDTGSLGKSQSATADFVVAGTFAYSCSYHPHMRGVIIVVED